MDAVGENSTRTLVKLSKVVDQILVVGFIALNESQKWRNRYRYNKALVIRGFCERIKYNGTFSTEARYDTIRTVLIIAVNERLDIQPVFLNGFVKEEIYIKQPEEFNGGTNRVCKLRKSLYG